MEDGPFGVAGPPAVVQQVHTLVHSHTAEHVPIQHLLTMALTAQGQAQNHKLVTVQEVDKIMSKISIKCRNIYSL
jgi:hypothetical protein